MTAPASLAVARERIEKADRYLASRTGCYAWRTVRYRRAVAALEGMDLTHSSTVFDVGAGWTEFDVTLREAGHRSRYIPVDACIDGTDLERWEPPRRAEFFVALEVIEHLDNPFRLIRAMQNAAWCGVVLSTPNPATTNVMAMDPTHKTPINPISLRNLGFTVEVCSFYGAPDDSLFATWTRSNR